MSAPTRAAWVEAVLFTLGQTLDGLTRAACAVGRGARWYWRSVPAPADDLALRFFTYLAWGSVFTAPIVVGVGLLVVTPWQWQAGLAGGLVLLCWAVGGEDEDEDQAQGEQPEAPRSPATAAAAAGTEQQPRGWRRWLVRGEQQTAPAASEDGPEDEGEESPGEPPADPRVTLARWLLGTIGEASGIHVQDLYPRMRELPGQEGLADRDLRARLVALGMPLERSISVGGVGGRSGIRKGDLQALLQGLSEESPTPSETASSRAHSRPADLHKSRPLSGPETPTLGRSRSDSRLTSTPGGTR
ncbi:hypothetical protein [Streptomyces carpaticus]|uniref:hypothetical protein n=1 Tax=Streptomyces carpaticus TaxID=285558 RepID=UPI0031F8CAC3